jgi:hypothetical protein
MEPEQAEKIVKNFSLIFKKLGLDEIRDEKDLPYSRDEIVEAYKTCIAYAVVGEQKDIIEPLKVGLVSLAHFQPNIGEPLKGPLCASQNFHLSVSTEEKEEMDVKELAKKYSEAQEIYSPEEVIPASINQNPCAHSRLPIDMIFHG